MHDAQFLYSVEVIAWNPIQDPLCMEFQDVFTGFHIKEKQNLLVSLMFPSFFPVS